MKKILIAVAALAAAVALAWAVRGQLVADPEDERAPVSMARPAVGGAVPEDSSAADPMAPAGLDAGLDSAPGEGQDGSAQAPATANPLTRRSPATGSGSDLPQVAEPASDEALQILRRTADRYQRMQSMRAEFVQTLENPLLASRTSSRGTLYQRRPDRIKLDFSDPEGDVIVSDGSHFWIYYPSVDAKQVVRAPAGNGGGAVDLQAQFVGDPAQRFAVDYQGAQELGGRRTHVMTLVPRSDPAYKRMKVWIDAQDHLIRRFQITENNENIRTFELSGLRVDPQLSDAIFRFTPPPQAQVVDRG